MHIFRAIQFIGYGGRGLFPLPEELAGEIVKVEGVVPCLC
jgi:hypothetical protein